MFKINATLGQPSLSASNFYLTASTVLKNYFSPRWRNSLCIRLMKPLEITNGGAGDVFFYQHMMCSDCINETQPILYMTKDYHGTMGYPKRQHSRRILLWGSVRPRLMLQQFDSDRDNTHLLQCVAPSLNISARCHQYHWHKGWRIQLTSEGAMFCSFSQRGSKPWRQESISVPFLALYGDPVYGKVSGSLVWCNRKPFDKGWRNRLLSAQLRVIGCFLWKAD